MEVFGLNHQSFQAQNAKYTVNGENLLLPVKGAFVAVGLVPEADRFGDIIATDDRGCGIADEGCASSMEGIFIAGDCRTKSVRQVSTAIGDGACAALAACKYLENR